MANYQSSRLLSRVDHFLDYSPHTHLVNPDIHRVESIMRKLHGDHVGIQKIRLVSQRKEVLALPYLVVRSVMAINVCWSTCHDALPLQQLHHPLFCSFSLVLT